MVGYDRQIGEEMSFGVSYQYRRGARGIGFENSLVPFSEYSPLTIANPLGSGSFQLFNLNPAFRGQLQRVMTNQEDATREYNGVELRFGKRHSAKWALSASLTIGKGEGIATDHFQGFWQDPNLLINRYGADPFDSTYVGRVTGSYLMPYRVNLGVNYRYTSGRPFTPTLRVRGLNQGDVTILTQRPGEGRHDAQNLVDIRLEKRFDLGRGGQLGVVFDLFNTFNTNTVFQRNALSGTYDVATRAFTPGAAYRQIQNILPPRVYRFGVRYAF